MKKTQAKIKEIKVPLDLDKALKAHPKAFAQWKDNTPLARRDWVLWLDTAKKEETRVRRIEKAISMLSSGKKRICCFGGINWLIKTGELNKKGKKIIKR
ncbi:MAG: rane protein [Candidatus Taylorbacteria bacterium]|nr:rane protein [Candidatus Taylorbacteria bacterium]